MLRILCVLAVLTTFIAESISAQHIATNRAGFAARHESRPLIPSDQSAVRRKPIWPFVVAGAVVGGAVAAYWYNREVTKIGDADFLAPVSTIVIVGGGIGLGAFTGWVIGSFARNE